MRARLFLLWGVMAVAAAVGGGFVGRLGADAPRASETELHALLHGQLDLPPEQESKLERIEADFAGRRQALELEMRAANVRLAQAIEAEHGYGPRVTEAIDETPEVHGTLHKDTLQTLFAMRGVLKDRQSAVEGTSVTVRVDLGGCPFYQNKNSHYKTTT